MLDACPEVVRGRADEDAGVKKAVGWFCSSCCGGWHGFAERGGMNDRCAGAVLDIPVWWCPGVGVDVADAGVVGGYPVPTEARDVEDVVHVSHDHDVGVEEADLLRRAV